MEKNESEIEIESDKGNKEKTNEEEMSNLFNDVSGQDVSGHEPSERRLLDDMNEMDEKVEFDEDSDEQEDGKKQTVGKTDEEEESNKSNVEEGESERESTISQEEMEQSKEIKKSKEEIKTRTTKSKSKEEQVKLKEEKGKSSDEEEVKKTASKETQQNAQLTEEQAEGDKQSTVKTATVDEVMEEIKSPTESKFAESVAKLASKEVSSMRKSLKIKESLLYKESITKQKSIAYDFDPRFKDDIDLVRPSGDFVVGMDDDSSGMRYYPYLGTDYEESYKESSVEEEEEIPVIDRDEYYEKYTQIQIDINLKKIESSLLQRKLAIFFKRRKMEQVLRESEHQAYDTIQKYLKYLDTYKDLKKEAVNTKNNIMKDLGILKSKRERKLAELEKLFNSMQEREKEIGSGLINTKTGNAIPDKLVERLINRQKIQIEQVSAMRLKYILLKDKVANKQECIANLDNIGEGLRLRDYEQLKVENRSHADKIEERDEELTRLRFKCQNTIQILAHIREKSSALDADIDDLKEDMRLAEMESLQVREKLNTLKQDRDQTRITIDKMRIESGLLAEPELLRDMESSMAELEATKTELKYLTIDNKFKGQQIRNIRKNIELMSEELTKKKSHQSLPEKKKSKPQLMKGRPSIFKPILPLNAFDHLRDHKVNKKNVPTRSLLKL